MAVNTYGALGQASPAATTLTDLYSPPSGRHASVRVVVCNRGTDTTVRVSLAPQGAADAVSQYVVYDLELPANESSATTTLTVGGFDVIRGRSASGNVSFTVTGIEADD